jgi:hypothetical protein
LTTSPSRAKILLMSILCGFSGELYNNKTVQKLKETGNKIMKD